MWRVWYDDGSTFSSSDGLPDDAPVDGVQIIMDYPSIGPRIVHQGMDYYWWMGDCWASGNINDLGLHLRKRPPVALVVLFGRWSPIVAYHEARQRAFDDHCEGC